MNSNFAKLRVCASCEWLFKAENEDSDCPKCGFGHYGARYVYGARAYKYAKTQEPWLERHLNKLMTEIYENKKEERHGK